MRIQRRAVGYILLGAFILFFTGLWWVFSTQSALPPTATKVVAGGDQSPLGGVFASSGTPALGLGRSGASFAGPLVFFAMVQEGSAPRGLFLSVGGSLSKVAAVGDPTPLGGTFSSFTMPVQNEGGEVAFEATLSGGSVGQGIFAVTE